MMDKNGQNSGIIGRPTPSTLLGFALGTSLGSREISWASGVDFPMPPSFRWSTDTMHREMC